jgi:hypothetical protein
VTVEELARATARNAEDLFTPSTVGLALGTSRLQ